MKTLKATLMAIGLCFLAQASYSQSRSLTQDFDGDGYLSYEHGGSDCDDLNFRINPGVDPNTDGSDCNCNGIADYQESVFKNGDINHSEKIDVADLKIILIEFGTEGGSSADVNQDSKVDQNDIENMLATHNSLTYGF